jgi:ABC-2 type transport system ATP-binding protein
VGGDLSAVLRRVGAIIEAPALYPYLSGYDNLRVLARIRGLPDERIRAVLATVELSERGRDKVRSYSQGMRQRLAIASALLGDPELIILDEPTNGLDPAGTVEIRELIRSLAAGGRTIFLCSHMLHEVEQVCSRVAILKQGHLLAQGRVDELLRRGRGIQIRVAGDTTAALQVLRGLGWVGGVSQQGDLLIAEVPVERAAELNQRLAQAGVLVAELREHEHSLEEFFLEVTGER